MNKTLVSFALGLLAANVGGMALAQGTPEVTVEASRIVKKPLRRTSTGTWINSLTLQYRVSYQDLDLTIPAGAAELEKRVKEAARDACQEIGREYPESQPNDAQCAQEAADDAMVTVRQLVAAAQQKAGR